MVHNSNLSKMQSVQRRSIQSALESELELELESSSVTFVVQTAKLCCCLHSLAATMPQINKRFTKDLSFSVSPWQTKHGPSQVIGGQLYEETQLPLKRLKASVHETSPATVNSSAIHQSRGHASQWQTKKARAPAEALPLNKVQASASDTVTPAQQDTADRDSGGISEASDTSDNAHSTFFEGTAVLALLPSGQISGHLLDTHSGACFGFMAQQLTAERECTRDTEWKLLHATIIDYQSHQEVTFAAERTAEDAATIQAPLQMHGEEEHVIAALQGHADADVKFRFHCNTILVSSCCQCQAFYFEQQRP